MALFFLIRMTRLKRERKTNLAIVTVCALYLSLRVVVRYYVIYHLDRGFDSRMEQEIFFFLFQNVQNGSGAHLASCSVGTGGRAAGV